MTKALCSKLHVDVATGKMVFYFMRTILILLAFFPLMSFGNETIESDSAWAIEYMGQFKKDMLLGQVYTVLKKSKGKVEFYNNCSEEFEYPMRACEKGYSLVTTVKLPGYDKSLGKGDLQIYFNFNSTQILTSVMHELYYPAYH